MCYWHAYVTGLFGAAKPMIRYMESLREPGRVTARCYHNIVSDEKIRERLGVPYSKYALRLDLSRLGFLLGLVSCGVLVDDAELL